MKFVSFSLPTPMGPQIRTGHGDEVLEWTAENHLRHSKFVSRCGLCPEWRRLLCSHTC